MQIPGFEGRSRISTDVPQQTAMPGSRTGQQLAELGGKAAEVGISILESRKKVADASDLYQKSSALEADYLDFDTKLKKALMSDGSVNPEIFGYKNKATGERYKYDELTREFWEENLPKYEKTAASKESMLALRNKMRPLAQESSLKSQATVLEMEVSNILDTRREATRSTTNAIMVQPELDPELAATSASRVWDDNNKLMVDGIIDQDTYRAMDKASSRDMTLASLDNYARHGRADDIISVIFAGNLPRDYGAYLESISNMDVSEGINQLRQSWGGLVAEDELAQMETDFRRAMEIPPELRVKYAPKGPDDAEFQDIQKMSSSLNRQEIEKYLRKALKLRRNNALQGVNIRKKEHGSMNDRLNKGQLVRNTPEAREEYARVLEDTAGDMAFLEDEDSIFDRAQDTLRSVIAADMSELASQSLFSSDEEFLDQILPMQNNPKEFIERAVMEVDTLMQTTERADAREGFGKSKQLFTAMVGGQYAQQAQEAIQTASTQLSQMRENQREELLKDPGGLFDPQAQAEERVPGTQRISKMDEMFDAFNIPPHWRKYTSAARVQDFAQKFNMANTDEAKAWALANERDSWGGLENWYKVMDQYIEEGGFPRSMKIAALMPNTQSMESFIGVFGKGRAQAIREEFKLSEIEPILVLDEVQNNEAFSEFNYALGIMTDSSLESVESSNDFREAVQLYAMHTYNSGAGSWFGPNAIQAGVQASVEEIVQNNFTVVSEGRSAIFAPKMPIVASPMAREQLQVPTEKELKRFIAHYNSPEEMAKLAMMPDGFFEMASEFMQLDPSIGTGERWENQLAEHGYWATSPDMQGVVLRFSVQGNRQVSNDPKDPYSGMALDKKGEPVFIPWNRLVNDPNVLGGF